MTNEKAGVIEHELQVTAILLVKVNCMSGSEATVIMNEEVCEYFRPVIMLEDSSGSHFLLHKATIWTRTGSAEIMTEETSVIRHP